MATILKIEKNIPIPGTGITGRWKELASNMSVGDSVAVENQREATGLSLALRKDNGKAMQRTMRRADGGTELRVWRVK